MPDTVVIYSGTAAGAVGLDLERKKAAESKALRRRLANAAEGIRARLERRLDELESIYTVSVDIDSTHVYELNQPLHDDVTTWPIETFIHSPMPGPDLIKKIKAGRHRDGRFEYLNPEAARALMVSLNASGGAAPNGWLATEANIAKLGNRLRSRFRAIIARRREIARPVEEAIRIIYLVGGFGGFGNGSDDRVRRLIIGIAHEMHVAVDFDAIYQVSSGDTSKDPDNTVSAIHGRLKEFAAQATGYYWQREQVPGGRRREMVRSTFVPTLVLSDANNAPENPLGLSRENFHGMISQLILVLALTDLGKRWDSQKPDFELPSQRLTEAGETCYGRSAGLSLIHLNRERLFVFAANKLKDSFYSNSLVMVDSENVVRDVRGFLEAERLLEGAGINQLSDRLLERGDARGGLIDPERFQQVYQHNTAGLKGLQLLNEARARLQLSIDQAGDLDIALTARRETLLNTVQERARGRMDQFVRDDRAGIAVARQWVEEATAVSRNMTDEAGQDTARFESEVRRYQERLRFFEDRYIPWAVRKNGLYKRFKRGAIEARAEEYRRCLEDWRLAQMRLQAHLCAIETLNSLSGMWNQLLAEVQAACDTCAAEQSKVQAELARIADHNPDFECPVGLSLIKDVQDLERFYERVLPEGGEEQALRDVCVRLLRVDAPLSLLSDAARLDAELSSLVEETFRDRVESLHVVRELERRFPTPEALGAALRERDRESFEYLQLRDSSEYENGMHLIRLLGVDTGRTDNLGQLLASYGYARGTAYQVIPIDDPERIIFLQFRTAFPFSDWAHFVRSREVYDHVFEQMNLEKYHVIPGNRALPVPGEVPSDLAMRILVIKAWVLDRLQFDVRKAAWVLNSPDREEPQQLGAAFELLYEPEGYRRAVDITSHFNCLYFQQGPEPIEQRLARLSEIRDGITTPGDETELRLAEIFDEDVRKALNQEIEWWRKNTVPETMQWWSPQNARSVGTHTSSGKP